MLSLPQVIEQSLFLFFTDSDFGIHYKSVEDGCDYYSRTKKSVSRKQILPMIKEALKDF